MGFVKDISSIGNLRRYLYVLYFLLVNYIAGLVRQARFEDNEGGDASRLDLDDCIDTHFFLCAMEQKLE